jgi:Ankyrin repeats (3 copies)
MSRRNLATLSLVVLIGSSVRADAREVIPLIEAAKTSDGAAVQTLLKAGADVNAASVDGTTSLHWAARRDAAEVADLLIRAGAHPDRPNRYGVTPLALAAANGSGEMIVYGSAMGDGNQHAFPDIPTLILGKGAGRVNSGRHIRRQDVPMTNLLLSLLDRVGVPVEKLGDSTGKLDLASV